MKKIKLSLFLVWISTLLISSCTKNSSTNDGTVNYNLIKTYKEFYPDGGLNMLDTFIYDSSKRLIEINRMDSTRMIANYKFIYQPSSVTPHLLYCTENSRVDTFFMFYSQNKLVQYSKHNIINLKKDATLFYYDQGNIYAEGYDSAGMHIELDSFLFDNGHSMKYIYLGSSTPGYWYISGLSTFPPSSYYSTTEIRFMYNPHIANSFGVFFIQRPSLHHLNFIDKYAPNYALNSNVQITRDSQNRIIAVNTLVDYDYTFSYY